MEESVVDFDKWIENYQPAETKYYAVYLDDGTVTGIYPEYFVLEKTNKILIDKETAQRIQNGTTQLYLCRVSVLEKKFLISCETKIDDVFHRIPDKRWSSEKYFDFYIDYYEKDAKIVLALSKKYLGTRNSESTNSIPFNSFETEIHLIFSKYNDPNIPYYDIRIKVGELINQEKEIDNIVLPKKFSVFTRRFFDTYIMDIK